jgi:hypothetical protein
MTTLTQTFQHGGVQGLLQNATFQAITTTALCFIIAYTLYALLLGRIPVLQDREDKLSKPGKVIALALAGITLTAILKYLAKRGGFAKLASHFFNAFGTLGGSILMAATFFAAFRRKDYPYRTTNWKLSLLLTGFVGMLYAGITSNQFIAILGVSLFFLPIIVYIAEGHNPERVYRRRMR